MHDQSHVKLENSRAKLILIVLFIVSVLLGWSATASANDSKKMEDSSQFKPEGLPFPLLLFFLQIRHEK